MQMGVHHQVQSWWQNRNIQNQVGGWGLHLGIQNWLSREFCTYCQDHVLLLATVIVWCKECTPMWDLDEKIYMEIPLESTKNIAANKVCRLKKNIRWTQTVIKNIFWKIFKGNTGSGVQTTSKK